MLSEAILFLLAPAIPSVSSNVFFSFKVYDLGFRISLGCPLKVLESVLLGSLPYLHSADDTSFAYLSGCC